jgi:hypothetical protein
MSVSRLDGVDRWVNMNMGTGGMIIDRVNQLWEKCAPLPLFTLLAPDANIRESYLLAYSYTTHTWTYILQVFNKIMLKQNLKIDYVILFWIKLYKLHNLNKLINQIYELHW